MENNRRDAQPGFVQIDLKDYTADPSSGRISWREQVVSRDTVPLPRRLPEPPAPRR
jgi:hypothetical protein